MHFLFLTDSTNKSGKNKRLNTRRTPPICIVENWPPPYRYNLPNLCIKNAHIFCPITRWSISKRSVFGLAFKKATFTVVIVCKCKYSQYSCIRFETINRNLKLAQFDCIHYVLFAFFKTCRFRPQSYD